MMKMISVIKPIRSIIPRNRNVLVISRGGNILTTMLVPFTLLSQCLSRPIESLRKEASKSRDSIISRMYTVSVTGLGEGSIMITYGASSKVLETANSFEYKCSSRFPSEGFARNLRDVLSIAKSVAMSIAVLGYIPYPAIPRLQPKKCTDSVFSIPSIHILAKAIPDDVEKTYVYKNDFEGIATALDARYLHIAYVASLVETSISLQSFKISSERSEKK